MLRRLAVLIVPTTLLLAACAGAGPTPSPRATPASAPPTIGPASVAPSAAPSAAAGPTVALSDDGYFVGPNGLTLYTFDNDTPDTSACYDDCEANWPVLSVASAGAITLGDGLDDSQFATTERDDGSLQVTFNHLPLYYFVGDQAPGDTNGDGVGGVWHLATAEGASGAASPSPATGGDETVVVTGDHLAAANGKTLYVFDNDTAGESTCYDSCEQNWPPLTVDDGTQPTAAAEVGTLGTTTRDDGSLQVTLDGQPLYFFAGDAAAGDTNGDGVGGVWHLAAPAGSMTPTPNPDDEYYKY